MRQANQWIRCRGRKPTHALIWLTRDTVKVNQRRGLSDEAHARGVHESFVTRRSFRSGEADGECFLALGSVIAGARYLQHEGSCQQSEELSIVSRSALSIEVFRVTT